jgi:hypothetical protein
VRTNAGRLPYCVKGFRVARVRWIWVRVMTLVRIRLSTTVGSGQPRLPNRVRQHCLAVCELDDSLQIVCAGLHGGGD